MSARALLAVSLLGAGCPELLGPRTYARWRGEQAGSAAASTIGSASSEAADADLHPVIHAYRESLRPFLSASELAALDHVDWSGTARGDAQRLRYLAADRALRRVLPLVLESERSPVLDAHAARLRSLPPLLNRDTDVLAQIAVAEAMAALERIRRGQAAAPPIPVAPRTSARNAGEGGDDDALGWALAMLRSPRRAVVDRESEAEFAEALAEYAAQYARVHGVSAIRGAAAAAAAADAVDVAFLVGAALQHRGIARERVLEEALGIADAMCAAARRGERLPRLHAARPAPHE